MKLLAPLGRRNRKRSLRFRDRFAAALFRTYPRVRTASSTFSRVAGRTQFRPFRTRSTVERLTFATRATSWMVDRVIRTSLTNLQHRRGFLHRWVRVRKPNRRGAENRSFGVGQGYRTLGPLRVISAQLPSRRKPLWHRWSSGDAPALQSTDWLSRTDSQVRAAGVLASPSDVAPSTGNLSKDNVNPLA